MAFKIKIQGGFYMFDMIPFRRGNRNLTRGDYFDQMFNNFFDDDFFAPYNTVQNSFNVDLKETDDAYIVEADLPGVKKEDINIEYNDNYLSMSAKRDDYVEDKSDNYVRRERRYGEFKRCFYIDNVNVEKIDATFDNGVLKLVLPKEVKGKETKRIEIR